MSVPLYVSEQMYGSIPAVTQLLMETEHHYGELLEYLDKLDKDDFVPAISNLTKDQLSEKLSLIETHSLRLGFEEGRVVSRVRQLGVLGFPLPELQQTEDASKT